MLILFTLEQTQPTLSLVGSVCSSHLICSAHLVGKRGTLKQARITLCPVGSVKVFCVFLLTPEQTQPTQFPSGSVHDPICALPAQSKWATSNKLGASAPCLLSQSGQCDCLVQLNKLYCSSRKVRTAGLKFKISNNFIWQVGREVHHRDSTLPPYGCSSHRVNSERLFSP